MVVHNAYYRHFGTDFTAPGKRPAGPLAVEVALQDDGTVRVAVDGHPLVGEGTRELARTPASLRDRLSFEIQSTTQDYPIQDVFDHVALVDSDGTRIPVRVQTVIPEVHTYRNNDDIREVNLRMRRLRAARQPACRTDWHGGWTTSPGSSRRCTSACFAAVRGSTSRSSPCPSSGRFNYHHYANLRYGEMHDAIKREITAAVGYPDADYASLLVYADVRLELYDPGRQLRQRRGGLAAQGLFAGDAGDPRPQPDRPGVGEDEKSNWMGYPDRKVHASWPWAVAYHEFLHGLGCPHTFKEPDSIMGAGLFLGTARRRSAGVDHRATCSASTCPTKTRPRWRDEKRQAGDNAAAVEYYERALRAAPDDAGLKYEWPTCLDACGQLPCARWHSSEPLMEAAPDEAIYAWFVGTEHDKRARWTRRCPCSRHS